MIEQTTLSNFKIIPKKKPGNLPDHNLLVFFQPRTEEDFKFSRVDILIKIQYMNGVVDYSITEANYKCTVFHEGTVINNQRDVSPHFAYFTPKMDPDGGEESDVVETAELAQLVDQSNARSDYKAIRSYPEGESKILVSDQSVNIKAGDTQLVVSKHQLTIYGKVVDMDFPSANHVVLQESGIMTMLPKAFIPPFCMPDYLPDPTTLIQASEALSVIKKIKDVFG